MMMVIRSTLQSNLILVLADDNKGNDTVIEKLDRWTVDIFLRHTKFHKCCFRGAYVLQPSSPLLTL